MRSFMSVNLSILNPSLSLIYDLRRMWLSIINGEWYLAFAHPYTCCHCTEVVIDANEVETGLSHIYSLARLNRSAKEYNRACSVAVRFSPASTKNRLRMCSIVYWIKMPLGSCVVPEFAISTKEAQKWSHLSVSADSCTMASVMIAVEITACTWRPVINGRSASTWRRRGSMILLKNWWSNVRPASSVANQAKAALTAALSSLRLVCGMSSDSAWTPCAASASS
jgi:hypothetical protein